MRPKLSLKKFSVAIPLLFNLLMQILPCSMHLWPNTMDWLDLNPKNLSEFRFEVLAGQAACSVMPPLTWQVQTELTLIQLNGQFGLGNGCFMTLPIPLRQMSLGLKKVCLILISFPFESSSLFIVKKKHVQIATVALIHGELHLRNMVRLDCRGKRPPAERNPFPLKPFCREIMKSLVWQIFRNTYSTKGASNFPKHW